MSATQCLRDEHRVILRVLDAFALALQQAHAANAVTHTTFDPFVQFFEDFADKCHHCKEEGRLFPRLESVGIPRDGGPIGVMLYEHEQGRLHVRTIKENLAAADGGDPNAAITVLEQGDLFLDLLRGHISKENEILFNMADQFIQADNLAALNQEYEAEVSNKDYCARFDASRQTADLLIAQYGVEPL